MPSSARNPLPSSAESGAASAPALVWSVHLLRREPGRLPGLLLVLFIGGACVWSMFGSLLPTMAAVLLLIGAVREYLLPVTYRMTVEGVTATAPLRREMLEWREVRRCEAGRDGLLLTPLSVPSRLDGFRGIWLRWSTDGTEGDRVSGMKFVARYAPDALRSPRTEVSGVPPEAEGEANP